MENLDLRKKITDKIQVAKETEQGLLKEILEASAINEYIKGAVLTILKRADLNVTNQLENWILKIRKQQVSGPDQRVLQSIEDAISTKKRTFVSSKIRSSIK